VEIDAKEVIGAGKVEWRIIEGGHEFPITRGEEVVEKINEVWRL
jgi:surfactin synthase thioesterase subunit